MNSKEFDRRHLWHPYSSPPNTSASQNNSSSDLTNKPTHHIVSADGVYLTLDDDSRLIDAMSSWWSVIHGYGHPKINQALKHQIDQMSHVMFGGLTHDPAVELGRKLLAITPPSLTSVFYSDSGSVAVDVAMKMAVQYQYAIGKPQKNTFLTIRSGYHGDTWQAMSVCDPDTGMHHLFKGALQVQHFVEKPPIAFGDKWETDENLNGLQAVREALEIHANNIAAFILEPVVQGAGGMYFYHPEYLNQCKALCEQHDVLLIFDEIATGFGRTGKLFATEHCTVEPDILCVGKALTGGYLSFAATLSSNKIADGIRQHEPGAFMHGPTFMANPLACAAAGASLDLLATADWQSQVPRIEQQFTSELSAALDLPNVAKVRAIGAIGVVEMRHTIDTDQAHQLTKELGVWLRPFGKNIYSMPPYIISESELTQVTDAMIHLAKTL